MIVSLDGIGGRHHCQLILSKTTDVRRVLLGIEPLLLLGLLDERLITWKFREDIGR